MTQDVTREELELAMHSFEQMGDMTKYAQLMESAMRMTRDNFDMAERGLRVVQSLHDKQLQGIDQWVDACKVMLPLFATAAVAGLTITIQNFNSQIAFVCGAIGFLVFFAGLLWLTRQRHKLLNKQEQDIEKLNVAFQQGRELANIVKNQAQDERGEMTDEKIQGQLEKVLKIMKEKHDA